MPRDPYAQFAEVYDEWQGLYPRPFAMSVAPRIRAAVATHGAPVPVLVDAACGTGIFARHWQTTHRAWTVYGVDGSEAMIQAARRANRSARSPRGKRAGARDGPGATRHARAPRQPEYFVQDLAKLSLRQPAGVITCMFDSLNHVTRQWDLLRVFRRMHAALAPGGIVLFDLIDELTFPEAFTGSSIIEGPDLYLGMETEYIEERSVGYGLARFTFFRREGSSWKRIEFRLRERRWFRGEIRELLVGAGFDLIQLDRLDPYLSTDFVIPRSFWACRRAR